jgi:hypothetical protein
VVSGECKPQRGAKKIEARALGALVPEGGAPLFFLAPPSFPPPSPLADPPSLSTH